ncbi:GNAT family N-acetyltransferase [Dactylosporangium sp. CA-052675]|uniref:GNAT family N-acetyltransferase n=1 Tax=Dactylosporangium sp. CA-052675 TaxID=3239927 RepID=UPI003D8B8D06
MIVELDGVGGVGALLARALDLPEDAAEAEVLANRLAAPPRGRVVVRVGASDGTGVALASISDADPRLGHVELLAVLPEARRRGVGAALLHAAEERLAALGATRVRLGGNPPCYAWPGIDVRYTPAVCLARRAGYKVTDTAWNMTADLTRLDQTNETRPNETQPNETRPGETRPNGTQPGEARSNEARSKEKQPGEARSDEMRIDESRLEGQGVKVLPAGPDTPAWVRSIWGDGWAWEVEQSLGRDGAGCYVAVRDGEILGFAAYGANRPSWFGPMGTAPAAEGLGVGRVLLRRCLADQHSLGLRSAQIGWAGPIGFYSKAVAARVERVFWIYTKDL